MKRITSLSIQSQSIRPLSTAVRLRVKPAKTTKKLVQSLYKVAGEDPTIEIVRVPETKQLLLGGLSDSHLNFILEKVKNAFGFEAITEAQQVIYRETVKKSASAIGR